MAAAAGGVVVVLDLKIPQVFRGGVE